MSFFDELKNRNVFKVAIAYTIVGWLLIQVAEVVAPQMNLPDWTARMVTFVVLLGFPVSLVMAWALELTPEGVKKAGGSNFPIYAFATVLVAITVYWYIDKESEVPVTSEQAIVVPLEVKSAPSVAVLPFVNMSSDPEQEFFSDGISEEILNVLTRIPNLKVAARTSSFQFKGVNQDIADIARQLRVNHILEGSVRKSGDQLRITAQLIEAETGFHLWSDTFDRKLEDVFAIQDEIANAIAGELRARLTDEPIRATTSVNLEAYELYLKGRGLIATRKENELFTAFDILQAAIEIEPGFVSAMATLARGYVVAPYFTNRVSSAELREQARFWANNALQLEPDNVEALSVLGVVANELDLDSDKALELLRKAVRSSPGDLAANNFLGDILFRTGNVSEAVIYESRAAEIDPLAPVHLSDLAFAYLLAGEFEKAIDVSERALKQNPLFANAHQGLMDSYWALGDLKKYELAMQTLIKAVNIPEKYQLGLLAKLDIAKGNAEEANKKMQKVFQMVINDDWGPIDAAFDAVAIGDFDMAGELLLKAYASKNGNWSFPLNIRLPEQAPDSKPWQEFWSLPEPSRLAEIRRANGLSSHFLTFGEAAPK